MNVFKPSLFALPTDLQLDVGLHMVAFEVSSPESGGGRHEFVGDPFESLLGDAAGVEVGQEELCGVEPFDEGEPCSTDETVADGGSFFADDVPLVALMNGATVSDVARARIPHGEESLLMAIAEGARRTAPADLEVVEASPKAGGKVFMLGHANNDKRLAGARLTPRSVYDDLHHQIHAYSDSIRELSAQFANIEALNVESFRDGLDAMLVTVTRYAELLSGARAKVIDSTATDPNELPMDSFFAMERIRRMHFLGSFEEVEGTTVTVLPARSHPSRPWLEVVVVNSYEAAATSEYFESQRALHFAAGECLRTATVPLQDDLSIEADQFFAAAVWPPVKRLSMLLVKHRAPAYPLHHDAGAIFGTFTACWQTSGSSVEFAIASEVMCTPLVLGATDNATVVAQSKPDKVRIFKMRRRKHFSRRLVSRPFAKLGGDGGVVVLDGEPEKSPPADGRVVVGADIVVRCLDGVHFFLSKKKV